MKLIPDPLVPDAYITTKGVVYVRQTRWGPKVQKWPKPHQSGKGPGSEWRRREFGYIAASSKNVEPLTYMTAVNLTRGTPFIPRDLIIRAMTGKLYEVHLSDGTVMQGWRLTVPNVQDVLEQLSSQPGILIVRGTTFWEFIDPGNNGDVLTWETNKPAWAPTAAAGGSLPDWLPPPIISARSSQFTTAGRLQVKSIMLPAGYTIKNMHHHVRTANATAKVTGVVYSHAVNVPNTLLAQTARVTGQSVGFNSMPLLTPYTATVDQIVWIGLLSEVAGVEMTSDQGDLVMFLATAYPPPASWSGTSSVSGNFLNSWCSQT